MDMKETLAFVTLVGFAIQQVIELLDPIISKTIRKYIDWRTSSVAVLSEAELKKGWMTFLAFLLGLVAATQINMDLFGFIDTIYLGKNENILVIALVLGAGTEGLNTLTKYFSYIKESRKITAPKAKRLVGAGDDR